MQLGKAVLECAAVGVRRPGHGAQVVVDARPHGGAALARVGGAHVQRLQLCQAVSDFKLSGLHTDIEAKYTQIDSQQPTHAWGA